MSQPAPIASACVATFLALSLGACAGRAPVPALPEETASARDSVPTAQDELREEVSPTLPRATVDAPRKHPAPVTLPPSGPRSTPLPSGFYNPMPGGVLAGYRADTGLDIAGSPRPVFALAAGTLDYAELGHTLWTGRHDTANTIRIRLDAPIAYKGRMITHLWYAHLSALEVHQTEGVPESERVRIEAGELLGTSGVARGSPHLHVGMLLDGDVSQYWGTFLLEDEIREVLGGLRRGQRLPALDTRDGRLAGR